MSSFEPNTCSIDHDGRPSLTYLDPSETSVDLGPQCHHTMPQWASRDNKPRHLVIKALADSTNEDLTKRAWQLSHCMLWPTVRITDSGDAFVSLDRCRSRLCPTCSRLRAIAVAQRVKNAITAEDDIRFVTLTLESAMTPLKIQIDHLHESYRRLRQTRTWHNNVSGAIATMQITRNPKTGAWHPHLHVLVAGDYYPHDDLKSGWKKASNGSYIVGIQAIRSRRDAGLYMARYVASMNEVATWPPGSIREYAMAVHGRRTIIATGNMHRRGRDPGDRDAIASGSTRIISLRIVIDCMNAGCPSAIALCAILLTDHPHLSGMLGANHPGLLEYAYVLSENGVPSVEELASDIDDYWERTRACADIYIEPPREPTPDIQLDLPVVLDVPDGLKIKS